METPVEILQRWEDHGAEWRLVSMDDRRVVVDLCTCYGEPVDRLDSDDAELLDFIRARLAESTSGN